MALPAEKPGFGKRGAMPARTPRIGRPESGGSSGGGAGPEIHYERAPEDEIKPATGRPVWMKWAIGGAAALVLASLVSAGNGGSGFLGGLIGGLLAGKLLSKMGGGMQGTAARAPSAPATAGAPSGVSRGGFGATGGASPGFASGG